MAYGEFISFTSENKCHYLERLWYGEDPQNVVVADGSFHPDQPMHDWLLKDLRRPIPSTKGVKERTDSSESDGCSWRRPSDGFRLLFGICGDRGNRDYTRLPFPEKEFLDLKTCLGIPKEFDRALDNPLENGLDGDFCDMRESPRANSIICYLFKLGIHATGFYTMALSHDRSTNITHGIILAQTDAKLKQLSKVAAHMRDNESLSQQPMSPIAFTAELIVRTCAKKISQSDYRLLELENDMGQHTWMDRPRGDPLKQKFETSTRSLNSSGTTLGITAMRLEALLLVLDQIYKHTTELTTCQKTSNSTIGKQDSSTALLEHIDYLSNLCRNMVLQTKYEQQRVQTLLAVAYNHMAFIAADTNNQIAADSKMIAAAGKDDSAAMKATAQASPEDNDTMKRIALETKRDSSAMKTIALLTMLFLPGTFVAAFFAMPLFNWDAPQGMSILKDRFHIYWIVTLPLTIVILVLWALCMLLPWHKWWARFNHEHSSQRSEPRERDSPVLAAISSAKH